MGWSFTSRIVAAVLQLVVIVLLARGLDTTTFAHVATANVVMMAIVPLNGFGLMRQLQLRRSLDAEDPSLPAVFAVWQRFMLGSVVLCITGDGLKTLAPVSFTYQPEHITADADAFLDARQAAA
jgi:O-antigen/teichoic acid export membrane protein